MLTLDQAVQEAAALYGSGKWAESEKLCSLILRAKPGHAEALSLSGIIAAQTGRLERAAELLKNAVAAQPHDAALHNNHGNVLRELGRFDQALESYQRALALRPDYAEAHFNLGSVLQQVGRLEESLQSLERALRIRPAFIEADTHRGNVLQQLERFEAAIESYDRALTVDPSFAPAHSNRGRALHALKRFAEALESTERALKINPRNAEAWTNRGATLQQLRRLEEALESFERALAIRPDYVEAYYNRGVTLQALKNFNAALDSYARAIEIRPGHAEAHYNRGNALKDLGRYAEALDSYETALQLKPDHKWLYGYWLHTRMHLCSWDNLSRDTAELLARIARGEAATQPFVLVGLSDSLELQHRAARIWASDLYGASSLPPLGKRARQDKIRIGYYSAEFHDHATMRLAAELFEQHDRDRFYLVAFSFGPDAPGDPMRERLSAAFDLFLDVQRKSAEEIARLSRDLQIDIAVDLKGYTQNQRAEIFAHRAAPVQVSYLGYPGTTGAPFMDYILADPTLVPHRSRQHYAEKIIYLPDSYQVNDRKRLPADAAPARAQLGLPAEAFVFCSFNSVYKITPDTFDSWMRILQRVDGSVLWLLHERETATHNLRQEAEARGVSATRLIFASRLELPAHLARHCAADLFIDTFPCNAHTTASDALWAGLPVLTRAGETFAGRVAASLLNAIGLPELVVTTAEQYESTAIELATDPGRLAEIRQKLRQNRLTTALFDSERFRRNLERAYTQVYERYQADLGPEHIDVSG